MFEFPLNMGEIIAEEINCRVMKLSISLPFPCLITQLCREAHVPILARIDVEIYATKKYDLEKYMDKTRQEKQLKLFAKQLGTFVDRSIKVVLNPYKNLHASIDNMEAWLNDRLKELTMLDLTSFAAELKKARDDILKLQ
ncbi:hypothetical protein HAX54_040062 [Datura stramonium]|uniref:Uncharacterized protein n=1 Tax=Datura stramonium TaxID=4076 RepID=A0ABS8VM44_DATST|nr:hypothetical protein [Datura stramonium]